MNEAVLKISRAVRDAGGRAMLVGGCVRDRLFGLDAKDYDLEIYFLEPSRLRAVLETLAPVNTVGEHFAVYKLAFREEKREPAGEAAVEIQNPKSGIRNRFEIDVSIPRRESKSGKGHRGFVITGDPFMPFEEAARRRDFTINAILQDPLTGEIVDPYGGVADLRDRVLRVVAPETFVEDSLRVLRAVQMAARFEMTIEPQTAALCRSIDLSDLPCERVWGEVEKLLLLAARPSIGLQAALELGVLDELFPQLRRLASGLNDGARPGAGPLPFDDAFERTKRRLDEAARLAADLPTAERLALTLAALCLQLPEKNSEDESSEDANLEMVSAFLDTLGLYTVSGYNVRQQVLKLMRERQRPRQYFRRRDEIGDGEFRRLAQRVEIKLLYRLSKADALASGEAEAEAAEWFIERARALGVEAGAPAPFLLGRHLLEAGMQPGKQMGEVLRQVYELQLDGSITSLEEAKSAAQKFLPAEGERPGDGGQ